MDSYTPLAAYLLLFIAVGVGFIFVHLVAGKFLRPNRPDAEKKTIYECGEPTIGSAWIQFDLRFYVVALLFVIFDVEVAFFFPWAEVFGRANAVAAESKPATDAEWKEHGEKVAIMVPPYAENRSKLEALKDVEKLKANPAEFESTRKTAQEFGWFALLEILVFFGVLLVGYAYLWKRGDLAWVRSTMAEEAPLPTMPVEAQARSQLAASSAASH